MNKTYTRSSCYCSIRLLIFLFFIVDRDNSLLERMNKNGTNSANKSNTTKEIKFDLNKSVQVTKVFAKEDHRLTKNEPIFTMIDTNHPGKWYACAREIGRAITHILYEINPYNVWFCLDGKKESFLSTVLGTVTKLYIHEWDILTNG